jgi:hypothetical protein
MTKMKDDITAHISNLLAPLKAEVERHEIRWENQSVRPSLIARGVRMDSSAP